MIDGRGSALEVETTGFDVSFAKQEPGRRQIRRAGTVSVAKILASEQKLKQTSAVPQKGLCCQIAASHRTGQDKTGNNKSLLVPGRGLSPKKIDVSDKWKMSIAANTWRMSPASTASPTMEIAFCY